MDDKYNKLGRLHQCREPRGIEYKNIQFWPSCIGVVEDLSTIAGQAYLLSIEACLEVGHATVERSWIVFN